MGRMADKTQLQLYGDWLEAYLNYELFPPKKDAFTLETMRYLVERFRHPERSFKSFHVAGSKGKGSVSAMIASILREARFGVGLYTSPHIIDFSERIATPDGPFSDELYGRACDVVVPLVESIIPANLPAGRSPSWFELVTLLAFVTFREAGLDWAVVETGLGGRLDATNVLDPEASVITPIELEHTEYLGDTIEKIAFEKAGIIKPGKPVFSARQRPEARAVFERVARERGSPFACVEDDIESLECEAGVDGLTVRASFRKTPDGPTFARAIETKLSFINEIQAENAALAAYAAKSVVPTLSEETIERGLSRAWLPGRFEIIRRDPPIVLDGAHTARSLERTISTFRKLWPSGGHVLFACAADKDVGTMAQDFCAGFSRVTVTRPGDRKTSDIGRERSAFVAALEGRKDVKLVVEEDWRLAIPSALAAAERASLTLLVTGSFYLVAEAKRTLGLWFGDRES